MDTSRNKYSNLISIAFSVCLALLVCFSIGIRFGIDNKVSRAIIAAIYCGIVVGLAFALNKVVNKLQERGTGIDRDKLYVISVIIASVLFVISRLLIISDIIKVDFKTSVVFDMAKIGEDGKIFVDFLSIDGIVATVLSSMFKLFGNTFFPVYLFQFIISIVTFVLLVVSVNKLFGKLPSALTGFGFAILPVFYNAIASDSADGFIALLFSLFLFVVAKYKESIEKDTIKVYFSLFIGIISGIYSLYSALLMVSVVIALVVLWNFTDEYRSNRALNTFVILVGNIVGFGLGVILDSYLFAKTGVVGFADEIIKHLHYRFSFSANLSLLHWIVEDTSVFFLMILCIIYCVMYWKNEEDAGHVLGLFFTLFIVEIVGVRVNNPIAAIMIVTITLLVIGGCGVFDLGYTDSAVRVYRIDDDMQPAVVSSIDDKPVAKENEAVVADAADKTTKSEIAEVLEEPAKPEVREAIEEPANVEIAEALEEPTMSVLADVGTNDDVSDITKTEVVEDTVELNDASEDVVSVETETENSQVTLKDAVKSESKYVEPEIRQSTNYGINDADFESLFSASSVPPKFVYNDIYSLPEETNDEEELTDEKDGDVTNDTSVETQIPAGDNINDETSEELTPDEDVSDNVIDDTKDKKAYVDSFFGYLYDDSKEFEAFEPLKPLDDIPQEKEVVETYVSHAEKFADLDIDLGVDAFDNINVSSVEEENVVLVDTVEVDATEEIVAESDAVDETVIKEMTVEETVNVTNLDDDFGIEVIEENTNIQEDEVFVFESFDFSSKDNEWEPINSNHDLHDDQTTLVEDEVFKALSDLEGSDADNEVESVEEFLDEDDFSVEEMLQKKIDEDFSYEEAINNRIANEEIEKEIGFSYEEALEKKLDVEEAINEAVKRDNFSYEEALKYKIVAEDVVEDALDDDNISVVESIESKLEIEDSIKESYEETGFSYQEAIETKLDVEQSIENATNEKMLEEFGSDDLFKDVNIDFSGEVSVADDNEDIKEPEIELTNNETSVVESDKAEITAKETEEDVTATEEPVQFIENPLPLPKKHVHREMDYGRVIPSAWMHYDIELDNKNNHYDI